MASPHTSPLLDPGHHAPTAPPRTTHVNNLTLMPDTSQDDQLQTSPGWRFSVIPPKDVWAR